MASNTYAPLSSHAEELAKQIVDAAIQVHSSLGPGLLESAYQACLCYELSTRSILFKTEVDIPIQYKPVRLDSGFRADILVDNAIIIELKVVERLLPIHEAQLMTYLKLSNKRLGFLLNFNVTGMKSGIKRIIL